jgi:hypothetical protein
MANEDGGDPIGAAAVTYGFRTRGPFEPPGAYRDAVIAHVETRDYAAAHELRVGRPQAAWTPADVEAFRERLTSHWNMTSDEFRPGVHVFHAIEGERRPVTDASLLALADSQLDRVMALRRKKRHSHADGSVPIWSSVLLDDGRVLHTHAGSDDRIAIVKALARSRPVFGFCVVFDAFMHQVTDGGAAIKRDVFVAQVGTREMRVMKRRPYRVVAGRAEFDSPPPPDINVREEGGEDPYAAIFVSVPVPPGPPS